METDPKRIIYGLLYDGRIVYVGQTKRTLKKRVTQYKSCVKNTNNRLYVVNHLRKYFNETEFKVLYIAKDAENLDELEKRYIKEYNTVYPNGLNLTDGGGSSTFCDDARAKMSRSRIGKEPWNKNKKGAMPPPWNKGKKTGEQSEAVKQKKKRFGQDNHFYGRSHSEESKKKISETKKGSKAYNQIEGRVFQYDANWNLIATYNSITEAIAAGFYGTGISSSHRHKQKHRGFYFRRENYGENNEPSVFEGTRQGTGVSD